MKISVINTKKKGFLFKILLIYLLTHEVVSAILLSLDTETEHLQKQSEYEGKSKPFVSDSLWAIFVTIPQPHKFSHQPPGTYSSHATI